MIWVDACMTTHLTCLKGSRGTAVLLGQTLTRLSPEPIGESVVSGSLSLGHQVFLGHQCIVACILIVKKLSVETIRDQLVDAVARHTGHAERMIHHLLLTALSGIAALNRRASAVALVTTA